VNGDEEQTFHLCCQDYANIWLSQEGPEAFTRLYSQELHAMAGLRDTDGLMASGDLNGDGNGDLIHMTESDYVHPWHSLGDGTFDVLLFRPWPGYTVQTGLWVSDLDLDGDGRDDLVHLLAEHAHPWLSDGDGTFSIGWFQPWPGYGVQGGLWLSGDFNGDGRGDLMHLAGADFIHPWLSR
jgi:hypothetical protein